MRKYLPEQINTQTVHKYYLPAYAGDKKWSFTFQVQGKSGGFSLSGMKTKLFGGDTPEQREQKIKQLEEQIKESEEQVRQTTEEAQ